MQTGWQMQVERVCPATPLHKGSPQHSSLYNDVQALEHDKFLDGETACHRTAGCVKGPCHQVQMLLDQGLVYHVILHVCFISSVRNT